MSIRRVDLGGIIGWLGRLDGVGLLRILHVFMQISSPSDIRLITLTYLPQRYCNAYIDHCGMYSLCHQEQIRSIQCVSPREDVRRLLTWRVQAARRDDLICSGSRLLACPAIGSAASAGSQCVSLHRIFWRHNQPLSQKMAIHDITTPQFLQKEHNGCSLRPRRSVGGRRKGTNSSIHCDPGTCC